MHGWQRRRAGNDPNLRSVRRPQSEVFIHTAENMETGETFFVGQDCATALVSAEEHELPRLAENEVKRKERWRVFYKKPGRCIVTTENLDGRKSYEPILRRP